MTNITLTEEVVSLTVENNVINVSVTDEDISIAVSEGSPVGHTHNYEPLLGNPDTDGYILSSTISGTRSWIEMSGGVEFPWQPDSDGLYAILQDSAGNNTILSVDTSLLAIFAHNLPTSDPSRANQLWRNGKVVMISLGIPSFDFSQPSNSMYLGVF